jgi:hypothetical protein
MIVFPLMRSVRLDAATASSRVVTLPMFVRSRPSRTRRIELTQLCLIIQLRINSTEETKEPLWRFASFL